MAKSQWLCSRYPQDPVLSVCAPRPRPPPSASAHGSSQITNVASWLRWLWHTRALTHREGEGVLSGVVSVHRRTKSFLGPYLADAKSREWNRLSQAKSQLTHRQMISELITGAVSPPVLTLCPGGKVRVTQGTHTLGSRNLWDRLTCWLSKLRFLLPTTIQQKT